MEAVRLNLDWHRKAISLAYFGLTLSLLSCLFPKSGGGGDDDDIKQKQPVCVFKLLSR